jgi:ankyrin repeat protein
MSRELFEAIERHDTVAVATLLKKGADPNAPKPEGWRPLHTAIGRLGVGGPIEVVKLLIQHGADVNAWDENHHETPILSACDEEPEDVEAARMLLEAGADPNVRRSDGESPLRLAARDENLALAELLLKHGAAKTIDDFGGDWSWTALGHAAHNLDRPMIELLLAAGANPEQEDDVGDTARDKLPPRAEAKNPAEWDEVMERLARRPPPAPE